MNPDHINYKNKKDQINLDITVYVASLDMYF